MRNFPNVFVIYYSVGLCCWKCNPKSHEECRESIFEKVLGKMESKPYWSYVSVFYHSVEIIIAHVRGFTGETSGCLLHLR